MLYTLIIPKLQYYNSYSKYDEVICDLYIQLSRHIGIENCITNLGSVMIDILHSHHIHHFQIIYENGFKLISEDQHISLNIFYPEFFTLEKILCMNNVKPSSQISITNEPNISANDVQLSSKNMHKTDIPDIFDVNNTSASIKDNNFYPSLFDVDYPSLFDNIESDDGTSDISKNSQNFNIDNYSVEMFKSDKYSYWKISEDVRDSLLNMDNINPDFVIKYAIFDIMVPIHLIDLNNDDNIEIEHKKFNEFYKEYLNLS